MSLVSVFMLMFSAAPAWATTGPLTLEWNVPADLLAGSGNGVLVPLSKGLLGPLGDAPSFTDEDGGTLSFEAEREQEGGDVVYWVHLPTLAPRTVIRVALGASEGRMSLPEDLLGLWHLNDRLDAAVGESLVHNSTQEARYSDLGIIGSLELPNFASVDMEAVDLGAVGMTVPAQPYTVSMWFRGSGGFLVQAPSFSVLPCISADGLSQPDRILFTRNNDPSSALCLPADNGVWHLLTVAVTEQQHTIWVDDEPSQHIEGPIGGSSSDLWISTLASGFVDEIRIYDGARTEAEHLLVWTLVKDPPFVVVPLSQEPPTKGSTEGLVLLVEDTEEPLPFGWSSGCSHSREGHGGGWAAMLVWMFSRRSLR